MAMKCYDCPRNCGVDRSRAKGFCQADDKIAVAKVIENFMWEEPCISGEKGALAIFFGGCNLKCEFCQNYKISHTQIGQKYSPKEFRDFLLSFDLKKFSCVDLITPTHYSSLLIEALDGFESPIPILWNSSAYEKEEVIEKLSKVVDVFMPDLKYFDSDLSSKLSKAQDYFQCASRAIKTMRKCKPNNIFCDDVLKEGVLIRHLVLPGHTDDSVKLLQFIKSEISNPVISLMCQFTPTINSSIKRKVLPLEYKRVLAYAEKLGLKDGYFQGQDSADDGFIPQF